MKYKSIYVAATSQHVGKTTSTLGLASAFSNAGIDIGYCKPVGQEYVIRNNLQVDKDVILFADLLNFNIDPAIHSPVILGSGTTSDFLEHPEKYHFKDWLLNAKHKIENIHDLVVYEGTGHPGVGSIVNLSNAEVARLTDSGLIMIAEGGIGSAIDMLNLCFSMFKTKKVPILGVILNKVYPEKMERIGYFVAKKLKEWDIPLLGMMPYDKNMSLPLLKTVAKAVNGDIEYNEDHLNSVVSGVIAGSLFTADEIRDKTELLLVVGAARMDIAINDIIHISKQYDLKKSPFSGIISTGIGTYSPKTIHYIQQNNIPVIRTHLETYPAVLKISRIEVKINQQTPWKVSRAIEMIGENINLDYILEKSKLTSGRSTQE